MKYILIDGNNLIGKIKELWNIQKKNPQASREKLAIKLDGYFSNSPLKATIYFDGFPSEAIKITYAKIVYSYNKSADDIIKLDISNLKNPKLTTLVSSDHNLMQYAKKCSCSIIKSEEFAQRIKNRNQSDEESLKIRDISDEEVKRLFGI